MLDGINHLYISHTNSLMFLRISPLENTLYLRVDNWLSHMHLELITVIFF